MTKHLSKLIWTLAFTLGIILLVYGSSSTTQKEQCDASSTEKCSDSKIQSSINIHSISRHFLDFNK